MEKKFMKGCEAIAEAAIRAGCTFFAGYPITPQNEIPEYFAKRMPEEGRTFVQGESEVAASYMIYGAASAGARAMTSSASCGISLKAEGMSYMAAARLPMVLVNVGRAGPGVGTIQPGQTDYYMCTRAMGHGGFRNLVFAPATLQETVDMVYNAFDIAMRDRAPVVVFPDGVIGAMMEPVELPPMRELEPAPAWATRGCKGRDFNLIIGGEMKEGPMFEKVNKPLAELYARWEKEEVRVEEYMVEDAEIVLTAYGTSARVCRSVVDKCREEGIKAGLIRPITLYPFPYASYKKLDPKQVKLVVDVEMCVPAQMLEDVTRELDEGIPVETVLTAGGFVVSPKDVEDKIKAFLKK